MLALSLFCQECIGTEREFSEGVCTVATRRASYILLIKQCCVIIAKKLVPKTGFVLLKLGCLYKSFHGI